MEKPSKPHGGARAGSGRKRKFGERSALIRVPESVEPMVVEFLAEFAKSPQAEPQWPNYLTPVKLAENPTSFKVPLFGHTVRAGFPSPADDYVADTLDLNSHLMPNPEACFLLKVGGYSMIGVGIYPDDLIVVNRALTPVHGKIVLAIVDGEFTVKILEKINGKIRLLSANPDFKPIEIKSEQELQIWGVVTKSIHSL